MERIDRSDRAAPVVGAANDESPARSAPQDLRAAGDERAGTPLNGTACSPVEPPARRVRGYDKGRITLLLSGDLAGLVADATPSFDAGFTLMKRRCADER